jgi:hypothetical protein
MNAKDYELTVPRPKSVSAPRLYSNTPTPDQVLKYSKDLENYESNKENYKIEYKKFTDHQEEMFAKFKHDLLDYLELSHHSKAELLFEMAWERGHAYGYQDVINEAEVLAELVL